MQVPEAYARGTLRLSTGIHTTKEEIKTCAQVVAAAVEKAIEGSSGPQRNPLA
jgi:cysteine sulfinate desulfinase/cysteine desulfurase-like protein